MRRPAVACRPAAAFRRTLTNSAQFDRIIIGGRDMAASTQRIFRRNEVWSDDTAWRQDLLPRDLLPQNLQPQEFLQDAMTLILTLASRNLFHDRLRLIATVVGIVFSIVLVTVQLGVFLSFERMVTTMIDHAEADFWIVPAETRSFEDSSLLAGRQRLQALSVDGVTAVSPVVVGYASWRKPNGGASTPVLVVGAPAGTTGLQPWHVIEGTADDLSTPDGVAIDRSYFEQLGIAAIKERAEINNQKARVVAVTSGIRSFTTTPHVFATLERARAYLGVPPNRANYYMVRIAPNADAAAVRNRLTGSLSDAEVLTPDEFRHRTRVFWLFDTGAGAALLGSAILGILVGTIIVAQTLYSSTKDHLKEFATLRAIGSSRGYILKVILAQALISAVVGFSIAVSIDLALVKATRDAALPIVMTPELSAGLLALTIAMCAIAAVAAIRVVTRIDPVLVFAQ
jgi:putative ABC transport system permease protein